MNHILHHELTRVARDMKDDIHRVNRPCDAESIISHHIDRNAQLLAERIDATIVQGVNRPLAQMAEAARPWYIQLALDELRRVTERQVEERIKDLRRSILGIENVGGALCGDVIRVRLPLGMAGSAASTEPQEAS